MSATKENETPTKGHWPKGRRRNPDTGQWSRTLTRLRALFAERAESSHNVAQFARDIAVNRKTVYRWINGTDRPQAETQLQIKAWVDQRK